MSNFFFNNKIGCWSLNFLLGNTNSLFIYTGNLIRDKEVVFLGTLVYPNISNILRSLEINMFFKINLFTDAISIGVPFNWNKKTISLFKKTVLSYCQLKNMESIMYSREIYKYNGISYNNVNNLVNRFFGKNIVVGSDVVKAHPYHLVDVSPWPLMVGISIFNLLFGLVLFFHFYESWVYFVIFGLVLLIFSLLSWWNDVLNEGLYFGAHTEAVRRGIRIGMFLFILSEILFFVGFFWAFFTASLNPIPSIGCVWPPMSILPFNPLGIPLFNTIVLLVSGVTVTVAHEYLITSNKSSFSSFSKVYIYLFITILLGLLFTSFQYIEYLDSFFNISDGIYGSIFYLITGFHGLHVIIGTMFLFYNFIRVIKKSISYEDCVGLELAIWYWHFVDVVWLFVYIFIYCNYIYDNIFLNSLIYL